MSANGRISSRGPSSGAQIPPCLSGSSRLASVWHGCGESAYCGQIRSAFFSDATGLVLTLATREMVGVDGQPLLHLKRSRHQLECFPCTFGAVDQQSRCIGQSVTGGQTLYQRRVGSRERADLGDQAGSWAMREARSGESPKARDAGVVFDSLEAIVLNEGLTPLASLHTYSSTYQPHGT